MTLASEALESGAAKSIQRIFSLSAPAAFGACKNLKNKLPAGPQFISATTPPPLPIPRP